MKTLASKTQLLVAASAALLIGRTAIAQIPSTGSPTGVNAAFVKLFGTVPAFTARVEAQVFDLSNKQTVRMPMDWAALDGKVRLEVNLEQMTSKDVPATTIASLKQAGMARIVTVFRPDKKATYVIYPGIQTYQIIPLAKGEAQAIEKGLTLEKTPLAKETIDGRACVKNKVVVKGDKGPVLEAVAWMAADLKEFPLLIEMKEKQNTVRMHFSQVRLDKPDASLFEPPTKYGQMK